jgi:ferredoxin
MTIFFFTSTGNSLYIAKKFGGEIVSIPQIVNNEILEYKDDVIGLVFPIYAFAPPPIVRRFLKKVEWQADYVFCIGTHGDKYGSFCTDLKKFCDRRGLRLDYCATLKMVDNALIGYEMENERAILADKKVEEHFDEIRADIAERKQFYKSMLKAERRRNFVVKIFGGIISSPRLGRRFITTDEKCTRCGVCAKVCPNGNISVKDNVEIGKYCEMCGGCIHNCPNNALHLKGEKSAARWRNTEVTLNEIIKVNNQN